MRARTSRLVLAAATVATLLGAHGSNAMIATSTAVVASVQDGDTLTLTSGRRVRLVQIDSPELGSGECYSRAARTALLRLTPIGSRIVLEADPRLDQVDRYGRLLRYVKRGTTNVNIALVRAGAAAPYFYDGDRGAHANRLLAEAIKAKAAGRGLWGSCPDTPLDPFGQVATGRSGSPSGGVGIAGSGGAPCDPSYSGACIPPSPPDLDCDDVRALGLARSASSVPIGTGSTETTTAGAASRPRTRRR